MSVCLRCHGIFEFKRFILSGKCAPLVFLPKPRRVQGENSSGLFSFQQPLLCSRPWHSCRLGKRGSSVKANYKILQVNITVTLPADRLLIDFITTAPKCPGHRQGKAWTWQLLVGFCGPLRKADESQFITAFEPCLPFLLSPEPLKQSENNSLLGSPWPKKCPTLQFMLLFSLNCYLCRTLWHPLPFKRIEFILSCREALTQQNA